jgi:hypothetical protein
MRVILLRQLATRLLVEDGRSAAAPILSPAYALFLLIEIK